MPDWFDAEWYLHQNPDVARAGMNPWTHYTSFGQSEGRLPAPNRALAMGHVLWRGGHEVMLPRLEALMASADASQQERQWARWELARWYAWQHDWSAVVEVLMPEYDCLAPPRNETGPLLLLVEALSRLLMVSEGGKGPVRRELLQGALARLERDWPDLADTLLAQANVRLAQDGVSADPTRLDLLNRLFARHSLAGLALRTPSAALGLNNIAAVLNIRKGASDSASMPLVSVIIPVYNAAKTLPTVLRSLYEQSWPSLELLLVDDASTDNSVAVVESMLAECPPHVHVQLFKHATNQGAYAARNTGIAAAKGEFITVHDADDWSHPQKIERQALTLLEQASAQACLSWWVRVTEQLFFHHWHLNGYGWVYPNISSLMFRREVFEKLGYWDQVRVNADTEYRERIEAAFGKRAVCEVLPGVPLAFGREDSGSLSQHSATHLSTQYTGVRYAYMQAARAWHAGSRIPSDLYLSQNPSERPFVAPAGMLPSATDTESLCVAKPAARDYARISGYFDAGWYLQRYIQLQQFLIEPFEHFWDVGASQGFDPGPNFSTSGYLRMCPEAAAGENPLWHYLQAPDPDNALPVWRGVDFIPHRSTVMVCAHQAGAELFGAERSLLDIVKACSHSGFNVVITLPEVLNEEYAQALLKYCSALAVLPYGWWQKGRSPVAATVEHFVALIKRFNIRAVHANTLVLYEPLRAAHLCDIPAIVHVRELPSADTALCASLGCNADEVLVHAAKQADLLIANSYYTRRELCKSLNGGPHSNTPIAVVPNTVNMASLLEIPLIDSSPSERPLRVGMLSSNLPKKGLADVEALSQLIAKNDAYIEIVLVGPETEALQALIKRQTKLSSNKIISYGGYVEEVSEVLADLDVVINLSHFQESFGRTLLEAMAASRAVVAYDWGALSELIEEGKTGFLVPLGNVEAVLACLTNLAMDRELCRDMGAAGRQKAQAAFSFHTFTRDLCAAYSQVGLRAGTYSTN